MKREDSKREENGRRSSQKRMGRGVCWEASLVAGQGGVAGVNVDNSQR